MATIKKVTIVEYDADVPTKIWHVLLSVTEQTHGITESIVLYNKETTRNVSDVIFSSVFHIGYK